MSTPSIQTLITQAQQVLNLKSSNEIRATLAAILANANVGTPLNPNLTTQQLWDEFYEIVRQPSDDIMSIITDQMMRMVFSPPAPGGAGADKQVIFNDGGVLAGDTKFLWDKNANRLDIDGPVVITGVSTFAPGTALLPALTTTGDTNTGIYYPAADTFAVTTGGTERYRADSTGLLVGTALSGGSISNAVKILAGIFSTLIGNTASIPTATPTTIFAAPSESTLIVTAYITNSSAPANFNVVAIVKVSGGVAAITNLSTAVTLTITLSGADVQVTQATGVNQTIQFNVLRLA